MMQLVCQGTCVLPKVVVTPAKLRFTLETQVGVQDCVVIPIGETAKASFKIRNVSSVNAKVEFNFGNCKDFVVENRDEGLLKPFSSRKFELIFKPQKVCYYI